VDSCPEGREHRELHVLETKVKKTFGPMKNEIRDQHRIQYNKELCDLYSSSRIVGAEVAQSV